MERRLGHRRPADLEGVDGREAVRLWRAHCGGDPTALPRLVRYCRADVDALVRLAPQVHGRLAALDARGHEGWLAPPGAEGSAPPAHDTQPGPLLRLP